MICRLICMLAIVATTSLFSAEREDPMKNLREINNAEEAALFDEIEKLTQETEVLPLEKKEGEESEAVEINGFSYYTIIHQGAYQHPIAVSAFGDRVILEDQSEWLVSADTAYKTMNWMVYHDLLITQNLNAFTKGRWPFKMFNQHTGEYVEVALRRTQFDNPLVHYIVRIDSRNRVYLEDGSCWDPSFFDSSIVKKWQINDTIIIGVNDGWSSSSNPHILINATLIEKNATTSGFVRASCEY